jgi:ferric-dicitrate binding protein FerR (iron transport regulator)
MDVPINQVEALLSDERFLAWYFKTDARAVAEWNERIAVDPAQKRLALEAVQLLETIRLNEQPVDAHRLQIAEQNLRKNMARQSQKGIAAKVIPMRSRIVGWVAAAAIVVAIISIWQFNQPAENQAIQTAYGETRSAILPDGSEVMLNANTTIDFKKAGNGTDREVWVNGEAFFHVKKTPEKARFIVHTGHFDVVVTGTRFNVINRSNMNNVLLQEGSVTIQSNGQEIQMQPGDYVEYNPSGIQKKIVKTAPVLAWTDHKFHFDNTPMKEVAALITEFYGIKVTLADDSVAATPINGILPNDNLDIFLQALQALPEFNVVRSENEIQIRKN